MISPVAWASLKFICHLRSFRIMHYAILNVILYAFYELNGDKVTFFLISFVKRIQNDIQDDVIRDAKWSKVSLKVKWRSCNGPLQLLAGLCKKLCYNTTSGSRPPCWKCSNVFVFTVMYSSAASEIQTRNTWVINWLTPLVRDVVQTSHVGRHQPLPLAETVFGEFQAKNVASSNSDLQEMKHLTVQPSIDKHRLESFTPNEHYKIAIQSECTISR